MIRNRSLRPTEVETWLDLCAAGFTGTSFTRREYFERHWYQDPWKDPRGILVAFDGKRMVSGVRIFSRSLYILGEKVSAGGIGEVCTIPEYRGRGLSSQLLADAIGVMKERGHCVSVLSAELRSHYGKHGWKPFPFPRVRAGLGEAKTDLTVRRISAEKDFAHVRRMYEGFSGRFNGTTVRDSDPYWRDWVAPQFDNAWVAEKTKNDPLAYVALEETEGFLAVREYGARDGSAEIFDALVSEAARSLGKPRSLVRFPTVVDSRLAPHQRDEWPHNMYLLLRPFRAQGVSIDTTDALIDVLDGRGAVTAPGRYLYWHTDAI
jgi:GNAT superfamily N-acetyltransferase